MVAWTEIYSVIKGSINSHHFTNNALPEEIYTSNQAFYSFEELTAIYKIYEAYEYWKSSERQPKYDLMDVVNHLL